MYLKTKILNIAVSLIKYEKNTKTNKQRQQKKTTKTKIKNKTKFIVGAKCAFKQKYSQQQSPRLIM
jgi:peroxiredoxin